MLIVGNVIEELEVVNSTNTYLIEKSRRTQCFEGRVVYAHCQTEGRGQRGNSWLAQPGENVLCSVLLKPTFLNGTNFFLLSKAVAIAVRKTIVKYCPNELVEIKWPNDIYLNKKKVSGILIENQFKGEVLKQAVVGVGINVNQTAFIGKYKATSICLETAQSIVPKDVLLTLLKELDFLYLELKKGEIENIENTYLRNMLNYNNEAFYSDKAGKVFKGKIINIENTGILKVEINEKVKQFTFKEIKLLKC